MSRRHYLTHKERARALVHAKLLQHNERYKHPLRKVFIKNSRSRWGSCSSRGNLNFNYRIVFLPEPLVDYIVVHELCHLKHFNHSAEFWALVAHAVPEWKRCRALLRRVPLR